MQTEIRRAIRLSSEFGCLLSAEYQDIVHTYIECWKSLEAGIYEEWSVCMIISFFVFLVKLQYSNNA